MATEDEKLEEAEQEGYEKGQEDGYEEGQEEGYAKGLEEESGVVDEELLLKVLIQLVDVLEDINVYLEPEVLLEEESRKLLTEEQVEELERTRLPEEYCRMLRALGGGIAKVDQVLKAGGVHPREPYDTWWEVADELYHEEETKQG